MTQSGRGFERRGGGRGGAQTKRPARGGPDHAESALTRRDNRETFRDAVFLWTIPFCALRMISGWAAAKALDAASASPLAMASSTLRIWLRMLVRRFLLTAVLREIFRIAFFAEGVFAMGLDPLVWCPDTEPRQPAPGAEPQSAYGQMSRWLAEAAYSHRGGQRQLPRVRVITLGSVEVHGYLFLNCALRLSMNARMPSFWSSRANMEWNRRRSKRTPSARVVS